MAHSAGKEYACNARELGSIPELRRSPREGNSYSLQYSGLENSIVHGVTELIGYFCVVEQQVFFFHVLNCISLVFCICIIFTTCKTLSYYLTACFQVIFFLDIQALIYHLCPLGHKCHRHLCLCLYFLYKSLGHFTSEYVLKSHELSSITRLGAH